MRTLVAAAALLAACGGGGLEEASEEQKAMQSKVAEARTRVEARQQEAEQAHRALEQARKDLEAAEQRLAAARAEVAKEANDAVLFRSVQQRLLDAGELEGVAISARVQKRVVTLEGSVPSETLKMRAEEIAANTTGVETVINQIAVRAKAGK
jgi:osmotically-inducible protein OsmY